jgi:hypothetical protein
MMFFTHILKTIEYFAIEGIPEIRLEDLPILFNYSLKLLYIYLTNIDVIFS